MFEETFLSKLDPSYRILLQELVEKIKDENEDSDAEANKTLIINFCKNYMPPYQLWRELFEKYEHESDNDLELAYYQFYLVDDDAIISKVENSLKLYIQLRVILGTGDWSPQMFEFPNFKMDTVLMKYEEYRDKPISKKSLQKYEKSKKIYVKIKSLAEGSEAWFNVLTETDDDEFVKQNVEYKLDEDLTNRALWKLYINYLQKHDKQRMLHTYSKYCRFFLDDGEMKENYKKALEKNGEFKVPWKNAISPLEKFDENVPKKFIKLLKQKSRKPVYKYKKCCETSRKRKNAPHYSPENAVQQNFAFKNPILSYIIKNANFYVGENLYKSSKYFYANYPHPFCYKLDIAAFSDWQEEEIQEESIYVEFENSHENLKFEKLQVTTVFAFNAIFENCAENFLSKIIPRISKCDAKYVKLNSTQILTFNELKHLIGHGNVVKLVYNKIKCLNENGEDLKIEEILKLTPKIMDFEMKNPLFSPQSAQIIADLPFQNKIHRFSIGTEKNEFEPYAFAEFIQKNASDLCEIQYGKTTAPQRDGLNFDEILQNAIDEKWEYDPKPVILEELDANHF